MRILIPFPNVREGGGGIISFIQQFSQEAVLQGHEVIIATTLNPGERADETIQGVRFLRFPMRSVKLMRRIRDYPRFARLITSKLRDGTIPHPDIIFGISYAALAGIGNKFVFRSASGPIEWELTMWERLWRENWIPSGFFKRIAIRLDFFLQKRLERQIATSTNALFCQSKALVDGFRNAYGTTAPAMVPCTGIDTKRFAPRKNAELKKKLGVTGPLLLFTGGFSIVKGGPILERALPAIFEKHPTARFAILGGETYSMNLSESDAKKVMHLGYVPHDQVHHYFNAADVFVFPTVFNEGFPNAVLEAMASGLPIIVSDIAGISEYVRNEDSALIIPQFNPVALVAAVDRVLSDKTLQNKLGKNARSSSEKFEWSAVAKKMIDFLKTIVPER